MQNYLSLDKFLLTCSFLFFDGWFSQNALLELAHASHERHVYECRQSGTTSISESHPTPFAVLLVATTTAGYSQGGKTLKFRDVFLRLNDFELITGGLRCS